MITVARFVSCSTAEKEVSIPADMRESLGGYTAYYPKPITFISDICMVWENGLQINDSYVGEYGEFENFTTDKKIADLKALDIRSVILLLFL